MDKIVSYFDKDVFIGHMDDPIHTFWVFVLGASVCVLCLIPTNYQSIV